MNEERLILEKKHLEKVKAEIEKERIYQYKEFEDIPQKYKGRYAEVKWGDEDLVEFMQDMVLKRLAKLKNLEKNPYFGRIDFKRDEEDKIDKIYVGKTTITDENNVPLTTDWRTPICTLYYDQSLGKVSYNAPQGTVSGNLVLKSQILIENGLLKSVRDTDLVTDDELLAPYLVTNADSRLKNIVASIQEEQNAIIRQPLKKNLIIQGVAGSGKTTVALHRAAYLIYNEAKYTADNFLIIGPNNYFLNYISELLPDLDTENIHQFIFEDLAMFYFEDKLSKSDSGLADSKTLKYITSLKYKELIDNFSADYVSKNLHGGIILDDYELFSEEKIKSFFQNSNGFSFTAKNLQKAFIEQIKSDKEKLESLITEKYKKQLSLLPVGSKQRAEIFDKIEFIRKQLKNGCADLIKKYFKNLQISSLNFYKLFITSLTDKEICDNNILLNIKQQSLKSIKNKSFLMKNYLV